MPAGGFARGLYVAIRPANMLPPWPDTYGACAAQGMCIMKYFRVWPPVFARALKTGRTHTLWCMVQMRWAHSDDVATAYGDFVEHLLSAHTVYVRPVCEALAKHFLPVEEEDTESTDGTAPPSTGEEAHHTYRRAHLALYRVVQVVPACPSILLDILKVGLFERGPACVLL